MALQLHAAILEEAGEHTVGDSGSNLRLDVVAYDGQPGLLKAVAPVLPVIGNEHRDAVDEAAAGRQNLLHVPLGGAFTANGEIVDNHVGLSVLQDLDDVRRSAGGFGDDFREVLAQTVVGHPAFDAHTQGRNVRKLHGIVGLGKDGFREVSTNFIDIDVKGGHKIDVPNMVAAQIDVHQAGD